MTRFVVVAAISLAALLASALWWFGRDEAPAIEMAGLQWFDPPVKLPEEGLHQVSGEAFRWDWPQGWTIAFFGYTHCPDVCPDAMAVLARAQARLGDEAPPHRIVFVSVDPYRDTPEVLREYLAYFYRHFVGVSGSPEALQRLAMVSGAFYDYEDPESGEVIEVPDNAAIEAGYIVNHFGALVLVDRRGRMWGHLYLPIEVDKVVRLIEALP